MDIKEKKFSSFYFIFVFILLLILILIFNFVANKIQKDKILALEPISINLLTSVHSNLNWNFEATEKKISVKPGEVTTINYKVENLGISEATGIATFTYFPKQFGNYITKINCFCYDAQTLKPNEKGEFVLVILIDPEVTKDSKTKRVKEATIQFTFFDYKEYKENKS